jgi:hypothetical protein
MTTVQTDTAYDTPDEWATDVTGFLRHKPSSKNRVDYAVMQFLVALPVGLAVTYFYSQLTTLSYYGAVMLASGLTALIGFMATYYTVHSLAIAEYRKDIYSRVPAAFATWDDEHRKALWALLNKNEKQEIVKRLDEPEREWLLTTYPTR